MTRLTSALFPSRTITLYLARLFITRILGVLIMLVLVLQALDLLSETGAVLKYPGNGQPQLWTYVTLRTPQLIARFLPYSVLLATLFTFFPLNQNSEVIAMRAAGLSAHQILAPMLLTALVVSGISFVFNERVVTRATATLKAWQGVEYGPLHRQTGVRSNVYLADGGNILYAQTVTGKGGAMRMSEVTWYSRDRQGRILARIVSPAAQWVGTGWRLEAPHRFDVQTTATQPIAPITIAQGLTPSQVELSSVNADGLDIVELGRVMATLEASGRRTSELEGKWWHKLSGPLAALLMPLLGAVAAFGLARSGQLLIRAVIGMSLGFAYFVVDNAALALSSFGGYPPVFAAWSPFLLFFLIGETVLIRTEE